MVLTHTAEVLVLAGQDLAALVTDQDLAGQDLVVLVTDPVLAGQVLAVLVTDQDLAGQDLVVLVTGPVLAGQDLAVLVSDQDLAGQDLAALVTDPMAMDQVSAAVLPLLRQVRSHSAVVLQLQMRRRLPAHPVAGSRCCHAHLSNAELLAGFSRLKCTDSAVLGAEWQLQ
jgi:hypothetical protein